MDRINELIDMHEEILRREEPIIISKLRMINDLYPECEYSDDAMLFDEIIKTFADIVELQKGIINDLRMEIETTASGNRSNVTAKSPHNYAPGHLPPATDFETDEQVQAALTYYFIYQVEKPLSSYTINDYCSRLKNLWKSFYAEYIEDKLPKEFEISKEQINENTPLLNVFYHMEALNCYISMKIAESEGNRNWANTRAAFNKFDEFKFH